MARYVVMERSDAVGDDAVADARIVRDGFSPLAFLVAPIWLLWHGLIVEAVAAIALMLCVGGVAEWLGLGVAGSLVSVLISVFWGLEGPALRLAAMRRRGWREWGALHADSREEAEIRYAAGVIEGKAGDEWGAAQPVPHAASPLPARRNTGPALGLLHYPGTT